MMVATAGVGAALAAPAQMRLPATIQHAWIPIQAPAAVGVSQGNNTGDHKGLAEYAFDFVVGTSNFVVTAAQAGTVIAYNDSSDIQCDGPNHEQLPTSQTLLGCWKHANFIMIRGDDGQTGSLYMHVLPGSVRPYVSRYASQHVNVGDPIGLAGTTGWSSGVHLHFELISPVPKPEADPYTGWWYNESQSVAVAFLDPAVLAAFPSGVPTACPNTPCVSFVLTASTPTPSSGGGFPGIPTIAPPSIPTPAPPTVSSPGGPSCSTTTFTVITACAAFFYISRRRLRGQGAAGDDDAGGADDRDDHPIGAEQRVHAGSPPKHAERSK
jgi:hypothetical protein